MSRPRDALGFLSEWDASSGDILAKAQLSVKYNATFRTLRSWAEYARKELALQTIKPSYESKKHRNHFIKQSDVPTVMTLNMGSEHKTMLALNDAHHPFHAPTVLDLIIEFAHQDQPDYINFKGDWWDVYQLSRFNKDPKRIDHLQDDIKCGRRTLERFREACPNARFIFEDGNHEDRLRKYLWANSKELASLDCLNPDELFGFNELEIDRVPKECLLRINDVFQSEHGEVISKHSGWTAKAMYEKRGGCGICGHSHRGGTYFKHDSDYFGWWENFCTCDLHPQWTKNPNWMHGFSLIHFVGKRFEVEPIVIINDKFIYGGELYG